EADDQVRVGGHQLLQAELALQTDDVQRVDVEVALAGTAVAVAPHAHRLDPVRLERSGGVDVGDDPSRGPVEGDGEVVVAGRAEREGFPARTGGRPGGRSIVGAVGARGERECEGCQGGQREQVASAHAGPPGSGSSGAPRSGRLVPATITPLGKPALTDQIMAGGPPTARYRPTASRSTPGAARDASL